mgnify:CR=1 FL=1
MCEQRANRLNLRFQACWRAAAPALDAYEGRLLNKDGTPAWPLQEEEGASASKEDL